ncbi:hypothetical protein IFM89_019630 [Coptis chinensis]|uniref:rRNA methyltransferase 1, mitochondrial n=1 Tax=Coptis chinensis TaxID=261450 RepID=A0A835IF63_9MAGN|nr:hypothetical protein IFM89_019630 [Coptis chinensis]
MYSNLGKSQVFPLVFRVSSQPSKCLKPIQRFKSQSFCNGVFLKPSESLRCFSNGVYVLKPRNLCSGVYGKDGKSDGFSSRTRYFSSSVVKRRNVSNGYSQKVFQGDRGRKSLPWIPNAYKDKGANASKKVANGNATRSSWEESADKFVPKNGIRRSEEKLESGSQDRLVEMVENHRNGSIARDGNDVTEEVEGEVNDDPRWDRIKTRYSRMSDRGVGSDRSEVRRWNKQEDWGRKTWKEASESTVPKMTGEGIYGVGPVLAALSSRRRDFYTIYVQEGLDLSNNNRKKKDKKGFEKILKIAEKIGLAKKEMSKHDLNMVVDNRPHQGLVLDASPLEIVNVRELDRVTVNGEKGPLWVALDEVTDPQNLGAIIRSAYFFGAAGVVLCAKNSAPLSGVVSKASAGSLELMELMSCKNMMQFLSSSAENGWRVLGGSVSSRAIPLNEVPAGAPTVLVLGSEGTGLRPLVERSCTDLIRIPGSIPIDSCARGGEDEKADELDHGSGEEFRSFLAVESLNVSVAAGVLLHHLVGNKDSCAVADKQASNSFRLFMLMPKKITVEAGNSFRLFTLMPKKITLEADINDLEHSSQSRLPQVDLLISNFEVNISSFEGPAYPASLMLWKSVALISWDNIDTKVIVAGLSTTCSQKIHNQLIDNVFHRRIAFNRLVWRRCIKTPSMCFLDEDVRLHPGTVGALMAEMEKNPDIFIQTGYPLDLPSGSLGSYCIYEYHMPCSMGFATGGRTFFLWGGCMMMHADDFRNEVTELRDGGYSDDMTLAALAGMFSTGAHKRLITSPPVAVFPHLLASDLSFSRYWNYLRKQTFVLESYISRVNWIMNHALFTVHFYLSWGFVAPYVMAVIHIAAVLKVGLKENPSGETTITSGGLVLAGCLSLCTVVELVSMWNLTRVEIHLCNMLSPEEPHMSLDSYDWKLMKILTSYTRWGHEYWVVEMAHACQVVPAFPSTMGKRLETENFLEL